MNVVMISTDRKIFDPDSVVRKRMVRYGSIVDELHIIVLSKQSLNFTDVTLADNVYAYPTNSLNKLSYGVGAMQIGREICGSRKIDLISAQDPFETGWLGHYLAKQFGIPLQIQVHTDFLSSYYGGHSLMNRMRVQLASMLLPHAAHIRVVSKRIKESLINEFHIAAERISVLPVYVDWPTFRAKTNAEQRALKYPQFETVVLAVGRMEKEKKLDQAIDVFLDASAGLSNVGLVIVGEGSERKNLERQIKKSGAGNNVILAGWQADTAPFYQEADVYLHTAVYEGYGMSIMEAAMAELPIVSSDVGITPDVVRDGQNGFVCPVGDEKCLIQNLRTVLTDLPHFKIVATEKAKKLDVIKSEGDYLTEYLQCLQACL